MAIGVHCRSCGRQWYFNGHAMIRSRNNEPWVPVDLCCLCRRKQPASWFFWSVAAFLFITLYSLNTGRAGILLYTVLQRLSLLLCLYFLVLLLMGTGAHGSPHLPPACIPTNRFSTWSRSRLFPDRSAPQ